MKLIRKTAFVFKSSGTVGEKISDPTLDPTITTLTTVTLTSLVMPIYDRYRFSGKSSRDQGPRF